MKGIKIEREIVKGVIFSKFHEKLGPEAVAWIPELPLDTRTTISLKSINILSGEHGMVSKSLAMIPFPSKNLKGLIKNIEIQDKTRRGGIIDSSLTLLIDEADDLIFYKYIDQFEVNFEEAATKIKNLQEAGKPIQEVNRQLTIFLKHINETLNDLQESELRLHETEAFPTDKKDVPTDLTAFKFKIVVCGDSEVGKTSVVLRFTDKAFRRTYIPTVGVNLSEKRIQYENFTVEFIIWDIAGESKFRLMRKHFYHGADGQLLMFDLTRPATLQSLKSWYQDIKSNIGFDLKGIIVGNKNDLVDQRQVGKDTMSKIASNLDLDVIETSALTGENVDAAFAKLGMLLIKQKSEKS